MLQLKKFFLSSFEGLLHSYSQVFFSKNKFFGFILLMVSLFNLKAGISGVLCVLISQVLSYYLYSNLKNIKSGLFTFNSLLVGIGIGSIYEINGSSIFLIIIASIFSFLICHWYSNSNINKNAPFLSIPFLLVMWVVILSSSKFSFLRIQQEYTNDLFVLFPSIFEQTTSFLLSLPFTNFLYLYFRSLAAIFFQYNDLAGIIIAIGLLYFSRIASVISFFGFLLGYLFYQQFQGDFTDLIYSYIGFNFILTAIAIGSFYFVPSKNTLFLLILSIPITALLISSLTSLFVWLKLPLYSLPFNITVFLILSAISRSNYLKRIKRVEIQSYSPEINYFKSQVLANPSYSNYFTPIYLPILGEWRISQGHNGSITHLNNWKHALDFDIINDNSQTFSGKGINVKDFLCYNMPIIAPADGLVVKIENGHKDNKIGKIDLKNNWGNTIIIKHDDFLYSCLSHLKKNSFKVSEGDFIKKGELIAKCGNSGRSPEPHLHFQLQDSPQIGSSTINYPIQLFDLINENQKNTIYKDIPKESSIVKNTIINKSIKKAFTLIPGDSLKIMLGQIEHVWKINVNMQNKLYVYCEKSDSYAYFNISDSAFSFFDFDGNKSSLLHSFYLAALYIPFYELPNHPIYNFIPVSSFSPTWIKLIQEVFAPFVTFTKATQAIASRLDIIDEKTIFEATYKCYLINKSIKESKLNLVVNKDSIESFSFVVNYKKITACVN